MKKLFTLIFSLLSVIAIAQNQNTIGGTSATCKLFIFVADSGPYQATLSIANYQYFIENKAFPIWIRNGVQIPEAFGPSYTTSEEGHYQVN